jgi:hypothetical protein
MALDLDAIERLFARTDLAHRTLMLLATLVLLRKSLRDPGAVVPKLRELGRRHVGDGAQPEYAQAWTAALAVVAGVMLEGAG